MVLLEYKLHKNIEMGDLMGLLDLIFGRKNKPAEDNTDSNMLSETSRPSRGHITTAKIEINQDNYEDICKNILHLILKQQDCLRN